MHTHFFELANQVADVPFRWGWLAIFAAFAALLLVIAAIIVGVVWLTGGFSGRDR